MAIEWKRVTWYSQVLAVVLFMAMFLFAFYLGRRYEWHLEHGDISPHVSQPV